MSASFGGLQAPKRRSSFIRQQQQQHHHPSSRLLQQFNPPSPGAVRLSQKCSKITFYIIIINQHQLVTLCSPSTSNFSPSSSLKFPENQNRGRLQLHPVHYPERNDHTATHLDHVKLLQQGPEHAEPARPDILRVCGES